MYARAPKMYRVLLDYVPLRAFETGTNKTAELALGPYLDKTACKGAITRAKKQWPLKDYYVPANGVPGANGRIRQEYKAEISNIRIQECEPVWKDTNF